MKKIFNFGFLILSIFIFGNFSAQVYAENVVTSPVIITQSVEIPVAPTPPPAPVLTENFTIRNGNSIIYSGSVPLPAPGTLSIADKGGTPHNVDARSVLAILKTIDDTANSFAISDLSYSDSFQSFLVNCITPSGGSPLCQNWQYAVNGSYPEVGMDKEILSGGESVYIFFGPQNKVVLSSNDIHTTDTLTVTAKKYDYENNDWTTRTGVTVGLTQPDPNNTFTPKEIKTQDVDGSGIATFSAIPAGSYNVGIQQDYYYPTETLTVSLPQNRGGNRGGGSVGSSNGNANTNTPATFDMEKAVAYLESTQGADGSFGGSLLYTDWATIALGDLDANTYNTTSVKNKILDYFKSNNTPSGTLTDNERHAMALLAIEQNPYSWNGVNYIKSITDSFDGTQFGDASLVNDDIFAIIPLKNSGYTESDDIITKDIAFIISKQKSNGSWEDSADLTGAGIQALKNFETVTGVNDSITKATNYLTNEQANDGGWNSVSSTAWAMQAMSDLSASWTKGGHAPIDYLATQQADDGAVSPSSEIAINRIWATSYAIPAVLGKPWNVIMQNVSKPVAPIVTLNNQNTVSPQNTENHPPIVYNKPVKKQEVKKEIVAPTLSDNTKKINPEALTATVVNSVSEKNTSNTLPLVLGILSGILLVYCVVRIKMK